MATVHGQSSGVTSDQEFLHLFPPKCRVTVDDVDEDRLQSAVESANPLKRRTEATDLENVSIRENPTARIKRFQVEAECRKIEFARLLEEHAQVIRRLKQMEETEPTQSTSENVTKACRPTCA